MVHMLKLLLHICTAILNTFYRVVANYPLHHFLVIFVEYLQAFLYIAIMVNLVCYIFLKFAYFVSFETINTLLDEKIILIMKIVTCGTAAIALLAQLAWKVCDIHVKCNNYTWKPYCLFNLSGSQKTIFVECDSYLHLPWWA